MSPVSDDAATAAAKILLAYHEQVLAVTCLDVLAEYHQRMVELLREDIEGIPARRRAIERAEARYHEADE